MHWLGSKAKTNLRYEPFNPATGDPPPPRHYARDADERKLLNDETPRHYADSNEPFG